MTINNYLIAIWILLLLSLSACVQERHDKNILISVDMTGTSEFEKVGIRGDLKPLGWQESLLLEDHDKDSIYTAEVIINTASNQLNFKLVLDEDLFELEGKENRIIPFEYKTESLQYITAFDSGTFEIIKK